MERPEPVHPKMTQIEGQIIRVCELRLERRTSTEPGQEQVEYLCGASGGPEQGFVLGWRGEDLSSMLAICSACPIPDALESRRACLNLVPVRRFPGGYHPLPVIQSGDERKFARDAAFFACRWFYTWFGQEQPHTIDMCLGCPHWFPRPPRECIPDYWPATHKMLRIVNGEETIARGPTGFAPDRSPLPMGWWKRLWHRLWFFFALV